RLALKNVASLNKCFTKPELVVANPSREICVIRGFRRVGLNQNLCSNPSFIGIVFLVHPVVDEDKFSVCLGLIPETIFRISSRSLKRNLLPAATVETVPGTKIPVEFKA